MAYARAPCKKLLGLAFTHSVLGAESSKHLKIMKTLKPQHVNTVTQLSALPTVHVKLQVALFLRLSFAEATS